MQTEIVRYLQLIYHEVKNMAFATAEINALLALYLNGGTKTNTATIYMGLCTSVSAAGVITGEPSATAGYDRVLIAANGTTVFNAAASGSISNGATISFPASTGAWSAGATLSYWFLSTTATVGSGSAFMWGLIDNGVAADGVAVSATGTTVSFAAGQLTYNATGW
jgi:hypothetical protein